jgi:hypothetical protein
LDGLKRSINQKKFQNTLLKRNLGRRESKNEEKIQKQIEKIKREEASLHNIILELGGKV